MHHLRKSAKNLNMVAIFMDYSSKGADGMRILTALEKVDLNNFSVLFRSCTSFRLNKKLTLPLFTIVPYTK